MAKKKKDVKKRKPLKAKGKKAVRKRTPAGKRARKAAGKAAKKVSKKQAELGLEKIGEVSHYFPHVKAAAVLITKNSLKVGDEIYIKGHTTDFKEKVDSIQLDHVPIEEGKKGQEIGLLVKLRVRIGDGVYKV